MLYTVGMIETIIAVVIGVMVADYLTNRFFR